MIGVIDSGVLSTHPQLAGYLKEAKDFTGEGVEDVIGHGTAVALIALFGQGQMNPPPGIVSAKVVDRDGNISRENVVRAIDWVVAQGAKVVNLSLGFTGTRQENESLCKAIEKHPEIFFIAAAGNDGSDVKVYPATCGTTNLFSIGAVDANGKPADYSGRGDLMAPGTVKFIKLEDYYYESAQAVAKIGRLEEARLLYEKSISAKPNAESEFELGRIDLEEKKTDMAVSHFIRAIKIKPSLAEANEMLGAALLIQGHLEEAEKALRDAIDFYPDEPQDNPYSARAHFTLGQTLLQLNSKAEARSEFEKAKELRPDYPHIDEALKSIGTQ
ncbi:MAG: S8 family serine peptidase [Candidatus Methylumidiphilus sp.]